MKYLKSSLLLLAIPCLVQGIGAQENAPTALGDTSVHQISLQEAVRLAQENAPVAVQARGQIRNAESAVRSAYGQYLPSLNFSAGQSRTMGQRLNQNTGKLEDYQAPPWSYRTGLSSSLTLFDGFQRRYTVQARKADVDAAESNEVAQQYNIALQVKTQYTNILAARESEAAARSQLESAEQQLRAASARVQAGAATMSDSLRSVIQVGNARLALLQAQNGLRNASAALTRLVGTPFLVTANPADTLDLPISVVDSAALAKMAVEGPAVDQAESAVRAANASSKASKGNYLPSLSVSFSRSGNGFDRYYGLGEGVLAYGNTWGFNLSFPLFNNFTREDQYLRARVSATNAEASLRDAKLFAQQNIIQQLGALQTAEEQIKIQQLSVSAAEEDLRVQQQRYALGASTLVELLTSQTALTQARSSLIQARQSYRLARAQIEAIIGRDLQ
jgi:outer membrane protein